jgi:hypothetical protein
MAKWADYGIFRVMYNADHTAIVEVEIRPDLGERFGDAQKASRGTVVEALQQGWTFVTVYSRNEQYAKGEAVHAVTVHGVKYLRTSNNPVTRDNLGELPEYARRSA